MDQVSKLDSTCISSTIHRFIPHQSTASQALSSSSLSDELLCSTCTVTMDGCAAETDPVPDPEAVLRQLIRQAEASSTSTHLHPDNDNDNESIASEDDDNEGRDDVAASSSASSHSSDGTYEHPSSPPPTSAPDDEGTHLLPYHQISATLASLTADRRELATLLQRKKHLSTAQKRNSQHQRSLERSLQLLPKLQDELKSVLASLHTADIVDAEDQSLEVIRTHKSAEDAAATSAFRASMIQQIPLLRLQSIERVEYDNALGARQWTESEDAQLRTAIKAAAMKTHTIALSMDPTFKGDALAQAAKMDEASALQLAEQLDADCSQSAASSSSRQARNSGRGLDWPTIAARVPSRSIEQVKTRWYGHLRPSVNTTAWRSDEIEQLIRIATPYLAEYLKRSRPEGRMRGVTQDSAASQSSRAVPPPASRVPVPWQSVAHQLGTGRTAHACCVAYCSAIVQRDQPDMTSAEDANGRELFSLFRGAWRFMALHATCGPNLSITPLLDASSPMTDINLLEGRPASILGKVGREAPVLYRRFRNTIDPALTTGSWKLEEDLLVIKSVHDLGTDNWTAVAARLMSGRNSTQCREHWNRRLKQVWAEAGAAATDDQGRVNEQVITDLLETKKTLRWTKEMDDSLLPCLDDNFKGKDGKTFVDLAKYLTDKLDVQLSDKTVRDRVTFFKRSMASPNQSRSVKGGKGKARAQAKAKVGESTNVARGSGRMMHGDGRIPSKVAGADTAVANEPQHSTEPTRSADPKAKARSRTTVLPGAKRRKL